MKKVLLFLIFLFSLSNLKAQQWLGSSSATDDLYRTGNVGIGATPQSNLHVTSGISGKCELIVEADVDNNNENDNPYITFRQDNNGAMAFIGLVGDINLAPQIPKYPRHFQNPDGSWTTFSDYQGTLANSLLLSTNDAKSIQLGTFGFVRFTVRENGNVGIGTTNPGTFKLAVEGKVGAREFHVTTTSPWPDYVFDHSYTLRPIAEVAQFVSENKHLPEMPSASEVETVGHSLGEMDALLLKKVEELTLYIIQQNEEIQVLKKNLNQLQKNKQP
jgi:hypothetical protein